ncbi:MAG: glycoside hydrolase family 15 protein [Pseudomonadota bacterium]
MTDFRRGLDDNPLRHMGAIGDQNTLALVAADGTIPYLCWPRLDSPSVFSALLSGSKGSRISIASANDFQPLNQTYQQGTNILETVLSSDTGKLVITDFMVPGHGPLLYRMFNCVDGELSFNLNIAPAPDYERKPAHFTRILETSIACHTTTSPIIVHGEHALSTHPEMVTLSCNLEAGEQTWVALSDSEMHPEPAQKQLPQVAQFWDRWLSQFTLQNTHRAIVERSILAFGLLHMRSFGSVAAAGTFGLPEAPGGERNWDYRYTWVRDAALAAQIAARLGATDIAHQWLDAVILQSAACERSPLNLMLALDGKTVDKETELDQFKGLFDARPVRLGNEASGQLQLDIFGELVLGLRSLAEAGGTIAGKTLDRLHTLLTWLADNWNKPDSSIWELRGEEKHYLFSRLMCWVAFRDGPKVLERAGRAVPDDWNSLGDKIADNIHDQFWCPNQSSYMQTADCSVVDAAVICLRLYGFLQKEDLRWQQSKANIRKHLVLPEGVLRYPKGADDGFKSDDNSFVLCTCWWIEVLVMDGDRDEATLLFDQLCGSFGSTGLASEEIGEDGLLLGNIPQLFSHMGLVRAALALHNHPIPEDRSLAI